MNKRSITLAFTESNKRSDGPHAGIPCTLKSKKSERSAVHLWSLAMPSWPEHLDVVTS